MIINLSKIDFGGITGGKSKPEEVFDVQPTTSDQTITPTEGSVFSGGTVRAVTKEIDTNIVSNNIKEGVTILGVAGTLKEEKPEESFNVQPTTAEQTITPTAGSVFSSGTVHAVTSSIDSNIQPENIKEGVTILGVAGTLSEGSGVFVVPDGMKFKGSTVSEIPQMNTSNVTDMESMFDECRSLTTIPQLDTSNVTNMHYMFNGCQQLTAIPLLDTSKVTNMRSMFYRCSNLTAVPLLDTSKVTDMQYMFSACSSLTTIPSLNTSTVTDMQGMFNECTKLTTIPLLNTSNVVKMTHLFINCSSLTSIPQLDLSNTISTQGMFRQCRSLTSIPSLNTSTVTDMYEMFSGCSSLTSIPPLDTSAATGTQYMFQRCGSLTTIPALDTSNVKYMNGMFSGCNSLTTVEGIDFSGLASAPELFGNSTSMPKITRFIVNGKINVSIKDNYSIAALTAIDYDSVKSILAAADRTDNTNAKTLAFNRTMTDQNGELASLVSSCTSKGWTISGLTLQ